MSKNLRHAGAVAAHDGKQPKSMKLTVAMTQRPAGVSLKEADIASIDQTAN